MIYLQTYRWRRVFCLEGGTIKLKSSEFDTNIYENSRTNMIKIKLCHKRFVSVLKNGHKQTGLELEAHLSTR